MKKAAAILGIGAAAALAAAGLIPKAVESAAPVSETLRASVRRYGETVSAGGALGFPGQREITSSLPLVIDKFCVGAGDEVEVGDTIAEVDRQSSAALIESLGQVKSLAIPTSSLSTAIALLPDKITSDCAGRVISTAMSGQAVQSGDSLAVIAESENTVLTVSVSELDIAKIREGQQAQFVLAAYPDEIFFGSVTEIADAARSQYNGAVLETVVDVVITPEKADERLRSGLSADAEIKLADPRDVCVVPYSAIAQDEGGEYVYVYEDGRAVRRDIFTGAEFADGAEIKQGVSQNDIIFKEPEEIANRNYIRIKE